LRWSPILINPVVFYPLPVPCLTLFSYTPHLLDRTPCFDRLLSTPACQDHSLLLTPYPLASAVTPRPLVP
jgi:hypothetical protein